MTALIVILLVLACLLALPLYVDIRYDNNAEVTVKVAFFTVYKYGGGKKTEENQTEKVEATPDKRASQLKEYFSLFKELLFEIFRLLKKHIVILNFNISYTFGFSDAAVTGIFSGVAHAVINAFMAGIDHAFKVKDINIGITPDFNNPKHDINVSLKVRIHIIHIFIILFNLVKISLKNKKAVC